MLAILKASTKTKTWMLFGTNKNCFEVISWYMSLYYEEI